MGSTGIRIAAFFVKYAVIFAKRSAIWRNAPFIHGKSAVILEKALQSFQDSGIASKYSTL